MKSVEVAFWSPILALVTAVRPNLIPVSMIANCLISDGTELLPYL